MSEVESKQSDIEEIIETVDVLAEKAKQIRAKAFLLRNIPEPEPKEIPEPNDFASRIKGDLDSVKRILEDAVGSLSRFAG